MLTTCFWYLPPAPPLEPLLSVDLLPTSSVQFSHSLRKLKISGVSFLSFLPIHPHISYLHFLLFLPANLKERGPSVLSEAHRSLFHLLQDQERAPLLIHSCPVNKLNSLAIRRTKFTDCQPPKLLPYLCPSLNNKFYIVYPAYIRDSGADLIFRGWDSFDSFDWDWYLIQDQSRGRLACDLPIDSSMTETIVEGILSSKS